MVTIEVDLWRIEPPADGVVGGEGAEGAEGAEDAEVDVSVEERKRRARIELRYAGERNRFGDRVGLERHPGRGTARSRREGSARGGGGGAGRGRGGGGREADDGDGEAGEAPRAS